MTKKKIEEQGNEVVDIQTQQVSSVELTAAPLLDTIKYNVEEIKKMVEKEHPVVTGELAHVAQDKLLKKVLEAIADGDKEPAELAKAALEVFNIDFTRWYK